mgnify:CR=1 FL=1
MAKEIKISIVIPIYNVAPYIGECLHSVMNQTWQGSLECILVDDCGTDNSMAVVAEILNDYQGKVDFHVIHHQQNRGLSAARNSGIDAVTGDYVFFLDSDDEIAPDCIRMLMRPLERRTYDFVIGDYSILGSNKPKSPLRLKDGTDLYGTDVLHAYRCQEWYMLSVNKLYRVEFLNRNKLRFREGIIHEDELWSFQVACLAKSAYAVGHETYLYKIREGSITVKKNHEWRCHCINVILKEMWEFTNANRLTKNKDVHNLIQNFQIITLCSVYQDAPQLLPQFYKQQRYEMGTTWRRCFVMDGLDIRKQVRDMHLLFPVSLSIPYLKLMFHFL